MFVYTPDAWQKLKYIYSLFIINKNTMNFDADYIWISQLIDMSSKYINLSHLPNP